MSFMGVGPLELAVILIVALLGRWADRLPRLAADIARTVRDIRRYTGSLAAEFSGVMQELEKEAESERSTWKDVRSGFSGASDAVAEVVRQLKREADGVSADVAGEPAASAATDATGAAAGANGHGTWIDVPDPEPSARQPRPPDEAI